MKKIAVFMSLLIVVLCSCGANEDTNKYKSLTDEVTEAYVDKSLGNDEAVTYEYGTANEILSREIKDYSDVKVKEHDYRALVLMEKLPKVLKFQSRYFYLYANSQTEELLNLINARDEKGITEKISVYVRKTEGENLEKEIDILFRYIDGAIVDYDEDDMPFDEVYFSYGDCNWCYITGNINFHTDSYSYNIQTTFVLDDENDEKIGIECIYVTRTDILDYCVEHNGLRFSSDHGIWCMSYDGEIIIK